MRILHTNFLRGWGGQSNRILVKCRELAARGHDVMISAPPDSELIKRARGAGLKTDTTVTYRGGLRKERFTDLAAFRRLMIDFKPEILHVHGGTDSWLAAAVLTFSGGFPRPAVVRTKHNVFPIVGHPLNRWIYGRFFDEVICISSAVVEQCRDTGYMGQAGLPLVPSACDVGPFVAAASERERVRAELGFRPGDMVVAMTGRLRPEKGHSVLLEAAPAVIARHPEVRFLLIGSGSLGGDLQQMVERNKLKDHVVLAGFRTDIPACLAAADAYVQPSLSEGLGTSVLEACSAGLAVVASRSGGIPDIIRDGDTGLLADPGSADQLAEALLRLVGDPELRGNLGARARRHVEQTFSVDNLVTGTEAVYRKLLEKRGRSQTNTD